uniref:CAP_N domain-containing protein n=1 Tax=Mesocestoides corti TaxID=53468 RepID=A0A5K3FFX6_MESCO
MGRFSFLNCVSYRKKHKNYGADEPNTSPNSIAGKGNQNVCTKETSNVLTNSIQFNNFNGGLDAGSCSLVNEAIDASKINLLPSDSCSVLMKQSVDRISNSDHADIFKRLDAVVGRLERLLNTEDLLSDDHSGIIMFNGILNENLSHYLDVCSLVGDPALEQAKLIKESFQLCLDIMQMSRKYSKPSATELAKIMQPLSFKLCEIADVAVRNRSHALSRELSTISDSISILSWINMSCSAVFVKDIENATKVSANATTQAYRETMPLYAEWMRAWLRVISSLRELVCDFYPVGLIWQAPGTAPPPPVPTPAGNLAPLHTDGNFDATSLTSTNSARREWRRQDGGKAFNRDALLADISRTRLSRLKHVEGFSYDA